MSTIKKFLTTNKMQVLIDQGIYSGFGFVITVLLAHALNLSDFGIYSTVVLSLQLAMSLASALIIQPYQVAQQEYKSNSQYPVFLIFTQLTMFLFLLPLTYSLLIWFEIKTFSFLSISIFIVGILMHDFFRKYYLAEGKVNLVLKVDLTISLLQLIGLIIIYFINLQGLTDVFLVLGFAYFVSVLYLFKNINITQAQWHSWTNYFNFHKKEGGWLSLVSFIQWGSSNIFIMPLAVFVGVEALGAFRLAQSLFGVLNIVFQTYENYVLPQACKLYNLSVTKSKKYLLNISKQSSIIIAAVLIILYFLSDQIMLLAGGGKYLHYGYIIKGMSVLYLILFLGYPIRLSIRMLLLTKSFFFGYLISFVFSLLFFNMLVKHFHIMGAIIGLIINQLLVLMVWSYQLNRNKFYLWK